MTAICFFEKSIAMLALTGNLHHAVSMQSLREESNVLVRRVDSIVKGTP